METRKPSFLDRATLPALFPTHAHPAKFWEQLGRAIATFGFLEQMLGKAIFAFTATRTYSESEIEEAWAKWTSTLEKALSDPLGKLATSYQQAVRNNQLSIVEDIDEIVERIRAAATIRNILCHASWQVPDTEGKSLPFFVTQKMEIVETGMDIQDLRQIQEHVLGLACDVMDTVTQMGYQLPGGGGLGKTVGPIVAP